MYIITRENYPNKIINNDAFIDDSLARPSLPCKILYCYIKMLLLLYHRITGFIIDQIIICHSELYILNVSINSTRAMKNNTIQLCSLHKSKENFQINNEIEQCV